MTFPKARLAVAACLFVAWLGFLLFLVIDARKIVLSKPQFLIAQMIVVAEVRDQGGIVDPEVAIEQVLWSSDPALKSMNALKLPDLSALAEPNGYQGTRKYLLPLIQSPAGWAITPIPRLGAYPAPQVPVRIYAWTPDTEAQVRELIAAKK
ncbi:MAG: hypothetical protein EXR98_14325 [Gemmataceae bacterium]|nr:hypothetical protein [Gemmataceae bacterium]